MISVISILKRLSFAGIGIALLIVPVFAAAASCPNLTRTLSVGSTGSDVTALQTFFSNTYQNFPTPTGYFGSITQAALKQWQGEHNISQTGTVGPLTRAAMACTNTAPTPTPTAPPPSSGALILTRTLSLGSTGSDVTQLQHFLTSQGLLSATPTGYFGSLTQAAVQKYQSLQGIVSSGTPSTTGYGAVGPKTRVAIASTGGTTTPPPTGDGTGNSGGGNSGDTTTSDTSFAASPTSGSAPLSVAFNYNVLSQNYNSINEFTIDFGDGTSGGVQQSCAPTSVPMGACFPSLTASHTYTSSGTYTATLARQGYNPCGSSTGENTSTCLSLGSPSQVVGTVTITIGSSQAASCTFNGQAVANGQSVTAYQSSSVPSGQQCVSQTRMCTNGTLSGTHQYASCTVAQSACTPLALQTQTLSCPTGQTGSITQTRTSSCATGATSPTWGDWQTTSNTCQTQTSITTATAVTRLWLHHEWNQSVDTISPTKSPPLSNAYSAFMRAAYAPAYNVASLPQAIKSQYVLAAVSYASGADTPSPSALNYETSGFDKDEYMFLHASDPANLYISSGNERVVLTWRPDERSGSTAASSYAVYRYIAPGIVDMSGLNWWNSLSWTKIATVPTTSYQDTDLSCQTGALCTPIGTTVCYRVQSISGGTEGNYSTPSCTAYRGWQDRPTLWWNGAEVTKTNSAPRGDTYTNTAYRIDIAFNQSTGNALQRVDVYAYRFPSLRDGCGASAVAQTNQCTGGFAQFDTATLTGSSFNATTPGDFSGALTISSVQPIIQVSGNTSTGKNMTADPVFRVKMTDTNGNEYWYPVDGGYMTTHPNNRIIDRFWTGYNMNPASGSWQNALASYQNTMAGLGYNTMYLDEWRPLKTVEWYGLQNEAPAIEYPYPTGPALGTYLQNSSPVDKWVQALGQLTAKLKVNQPSMKLIGNTIKRYPGEQSGLTSLIRQSVSLLDGALEEECIAGVGGIHTGQQWLSDLSAMEEFAQGGKTVVCLTRSNSLGSLSGKTVDDGIVPERRMYTLASWLLVYDPNKQMYYAPNEINTDWIQYTTYQYPDINMFPEYFVNLGTPVGTRTQVGSVWKRDFTNGVIYVNPSTSAANYTLSSAMNKVTITGVVNQPYTVAGSCATYANGKCEENPGRVEPVSAPAGTYSLQAGQAVIFVK